MSHPKWRTTALSALGILVTASLLMATAFATPEQGKGKKTPKKNTKTVKKGNKEAIAAGKKVFETNCTSCHKVADKGGDTGPDLTKTAADAKHTAKWLEEKVVNPKASNPDSSMPAYEDSIKGKDLKNLVAYLSSLK